MPQRQATPSPEFWSDFDGTAVELVSKFDPRNWLKYPLPSMVGYTAFLRGVRRHDVEIAGVISRRPDIPIRRFVTERSIVKLGLDAYLKPDHIVLTGSEEHKGRYIAGRALHRPVGLIDDKPHKVGPTILAGLSSGPGSPNFAGQQVRVALGVVNHPKSEGYTAQFVEQVRDESEATGISVVPRVSDGVINLHGPDRSFKLSIVQLAAYGEATGSNFAQYLIDQSTRVIQQ